MPRKKTSKTFFKINPLTFFLFFIFILITGYLTYNFLFKSKPIEDFDINVINTSENKPNVVLVVLDDVDEKLVNQMLSLDLLPNIQREIVSKSVRFSNSFATDSACCPSRASILTGLYPHNHQVKSVINSSTTHPTQIYGAWDGFKQVENKTIAKYLKEKDYVNGFVGKFFHGYGLGNYNSDCSKTNYKPREGEKDMVFNAGWDFFKAILNPPYCYKPGFLSLQIEKGNGSEGPWEVRPQRTELAFVSAQSDYFIKKHKDENFFLYVAPLSPHVTYADERNKNPWASVVESPQCYNDPKINSYQASDYSQKALGGKCPADFIKKFKNQLNIESRSTGTAKYRLEISNVDLSPLSLDSNAFANVENNSPWENNWRKLKTSDEDNRSTTSIYSKNDYKGLMNLHLERMDAMLSVDVMVGKLFESLKSSGETDRDGNLKNTIVIFTSDNGYLNGEHNLSNKIAPYEESIKVPLFVRYDDLIKNKGSTKDFIALNIDIAPTILSLVGLDWKSRTDGRALNEALPNKPWRKSFIVENWKFSNAYWEFPDYIAYSDLNQKFVEYFNNSDDINSRQKPIYGQYFDIRSVADKFEMNNLYTQVKQDFSKYNKLKSISNNLFTCKLDSCREADIQTVDLR